MNGKDILEAMGFVDEKYVQAAAAPSRPRRWYWPGVAAAACAALIVGTGLIALRLNGQKTVTEELALSAAYDSAERMAESALSSGSTAPLEMTVRVLERTGETLRCVVEDSGTGGFISGQEITVVLDSGYSSMSGYSENESAPYSEDTEDVAAGGETLWIQYNLGEDDATVIAITWLPVSGDADSQ